MGGGGTEVAGGAATKLLTRQEAALCSALALLPAEYLALKAAILKVLLVLNIYDS